MGLGNGSACRVHGIFVDWITIVIAIVIVIAIEEIDYDNDWELESARYSVEKEEENN